MADTLLDSLQIERPGYSEEVTWHRFLLDAYKGSGGFQGRIVAPDASYFGAASQMYGTNTVTSSTRGSTILHSYLDRHPREDAPKYKSRVEASHYPNYVEPLTDLKVSYVLRKPPVEQGRPQEVAAWHQNCNGNGLPFSSVRKMLMTRSANLGWAPVLVDLPPGALDAQGNPIQLTRAQAQQAGYSPYPVPLFPANLPDYEVDESGQFKMAKVKTSTTRRSSWRDKGEQVDCYTIWTPETYSKYEVVDGDVITIAEDVTHKFGRVPLVIWKHKEDPDDPIKGLPMHGQVSLEARALFNRVSEFEEHLRGQVFAVLVLAMRDADGGNISVGTDNALTIDPDQARSHEFIAPPASVAATYEKRIEATIREMYRMGRVEFTRPTGAATSGVSRRFEFAQTNQALSDFAAQGARAELETDRIVASLLGVDASGESLKAQEDFDVDDLQADLKAAADSLTLSLGAEADRLTRLSVAKKLHPTMTADQRELVESEIQALADQARQDAAAAREFNDFEADGDVGDVGDPMEDPSDPLRA